MEKNDFDQASLFEEVVRSEQKKELVIVKKTDRVLSKNQQTFNRYVKKNERLQIELQQTEMVLGEKLVYYGQQVHPLERETLLVQKKLVKQLFSFYKGNLPISKTDRKILKEIIANQLNDIMRLDKEPLDEELKKIFKAVEGISYEKAREEDFAMMKEEMEDIFEEFGFEMNLDGLHSDMTEEEMLKKVREMQDNIQAHWEKLDKENDSRKRKKTKKQAEKEERERQVEEARKKTLPESTGSWPKCYTLTWSRMQV